MFLALALTLASPAVACEPLPGALLVYHGGDGASLWLPHPCDVVVTETDVVVDGASMAAFMTGVVETRLAAQRAFPKTEDGRAVLAVDRIRERAFAALRRADRHGRDVDAAQAALERVRGVTDVQVTDQGASFRVVADDGRSMSFALSDSHPTDAGMRPDPPVSDAAVILDALRDGRAVVLHGTGLPPVIEAEPWCSELSAAALALTPDADAEQRAATLALLETTRMSQDGCVSGLSLGAGARVIDAIAGAAPE